MAYISFQPQDYFNTKLYTGDGSASNRSLTGVGFQPDWVWNKSRSNAYNHYIFDAVRGAGQRIGSNSASAEDDKSAEFISFDSDGFTVDNDAGSLAINASSVTYANWCWKANGQGSANTDGSINTTYTSANTTSGFSIVSFTGTGSAGTVGHGLGVAPKMIILKNRSTSSNWQVYHTGLTSASYTINLDATSAQSNDSTYWNGTDPTSSVFSVGTNFRTNGSGNNLIAYCFADVKGFSKFGEYVGNGSTDGTFVYTGFKPAFVIVKRYSNTGTWLMLDNKRDPINQTTNGLFPSENNAEATGYNFDILSNGFKLRMSGTGENGSGSNYIYMAFAEAPLVSSNDIPATAR